MPVGVGEDEVAGVAGGVLVDGHQAGDAAALLVLAADQVAGALRGDHADVDAGGRLDLAEVDREAVGEHQQVAVGDPVGDLLAQISACFSSGSRIITMSPRLAASATSSTSRPARLGVGRGSRSRGAGRRRRRRRSPSG